MQKTAALHAAVFLAIAKKNSGGGVQPPPPSWARVKGIIIVRPLFPFYWGD